MSLSLKEHQVLQYLGIYAAAHLVGIDLQHLLVYSIDSYLLVYIEALVYNITFQDSLIIQFLTQSPLRATTQ